MSLSELREMRIKLRYECKWKVDISHVSHLTRPDSTLQLKVYKLSPHSERRYNAQCLQVP